MRARRFLLVTAALSSLAAAEACKKESMDNLPGNPKGMSYDPDAGTWVVPPMPPSVDAAPPPIATPVLTAIPPPGNPKGMSYDAGKKKP